MIVIDALRFDFVAPYADPAVRANSSGSTAADAEAGEVNFYRNTLPVLHTKLRTQPERAQLFQFIADPPTVTMQRLKALTTGWILLCLPSRFLLSLSIYLSVRHLYIFSSFPLLIPAWPFDLRTLSVLPSGGLPSFLDIKDNFDSTAVFEDNIIDQLSKLQRPSVFMGDDTWTSLFPRGFTKAYPYPSFNVKDLYTVDNGCLEHLLPELSTHQWDLVVSHFLGVDHVGHSYSASHPLLKIKLAQMNHVIEQVIDTVDRGPFANETLVLVLGDHGMTPDGNHGAVTLSSLSLSLFYLSLLYYSASTWWFLSCPLAHVITALPGAAARAYTLLPFPPLYSPFFVSVFLFLHGIFVENLFVCNLYFAAPQVVIQTKRPSQRCLPTVRALPLQPFPYLRST